MGSCYSVTLKKVVVNDYVETIMNAKNACDYNMEGDALEGPVDYIYGMSYMHYMK